MAHPGGVITLRPVAYDNGHWQFEERMGPPYVGFVYAIYDEYLKKAYIGKKVYLGTGVRNQGKDTGWRSYASSSKIIDAFLKERPKSEFKFVCLEQYKTKGTLSYSETWSLCFVEAPTRDAFYNKRVEEVTWNVKEPITQRHKDKLQELLNWIDRG